MKQMKLPPLIPLQPLSWQNMLMGLCLVAGYLNLMLHLQPLTSINIGQGWDGYFYFQMASGADNSDIHYRFALRYGLPWLASFFPSQDIFLNFQLINLGCALLYASACYALLLRCSANMHPAVPVIGWLLLCTGNLSPIPSVLWYPIQTDIVCNLFALIFLAMIINGRISLLVVALLFFAGTTVRENFPEFLLYGLLRVRLSYDHKQTVGNNISLLINNNRTIIAVVSVGLLASLLGLYSSFLHTGLTPFVDNDSFMFDLSYAYTHNINNPLHLLSIIINTISAIFLIFIANACSGLSIKYHEHLFGVPFVKLIMAIYILITFIGGTNPERFLYWTMPLFVLCILPAINNLIEHKRYLLLGSCMLWALFIQRTLVPIDIDGIHKACDIHAILTGHSNWIGHWSDQCDTLAQQHLVELAAAVAIITGIFATFPRMYVFLKTKTGR